MKKLIITILLASFALVGACSKKGYDSNLVRLNGNYSSTSDTEETTDITSFNTTWSGIAYSGSLDTSNQDKRAIANFYGYNTVHFTKASAYYGYVSTSGISGSIFSDTHFLRNYFNFGDISYYSSGLKASPAPKNIGSVNNVKVVFKANVDESTGDILTDDAYLYIEFGTSAAGTLKVSFNNLDSMTSNSTTVQATFSDACGDVTFSADLVSTGSYYNLENITISYYNNADSYTNSACYYNGNTPSGSPWGLVRMSTFPERLPDGLGNGASYSIIDGDDTIVLEQE